MVLCRSRLPWRSSSAHPFWGLSDRYGRRPVLLLGLMGMALNFFVTALATEYWVLLAVRIMGGALCANIAVANAYVADITLQRPCSQLRHAGAMFGLGFILRARYWRLAGDHNVHWPFFLAGSLTLLNALYGWFVLPESLAPERGEIFSIKNVHPFAALGRLRQLEGVEPLLWVIGLSTLAQFMLHTSWMLYTEFKFGWTRVTTACRCLWSV